MPGVGIKDEFYILDAQIFVTVKEHLYAVVRPDRVFLACNNQHGQALRYRFLALGIWVADFTIVIVEANTSLFATLIDLPKKESGLP